MFHFAVGGSLGLGLGGPADYSLSTPAPAQWSGVPVLAKTGGTQCQMTIQDKIFRYIDISFKKE